MATQKIDHQKAFNMLFFLEFWERFGYYGLQAVLASFFVKSLGMDDAESFIVFGAFSAMVYGYVALGGYIGDKVLGTQRTIIVGAVTLMIGYGLMAFAGTDKSLVFFALAVVACGNVFSRPILPVCCPSCMKMIRTIWTVRSPCIIWR